MDNKLLEQLIGEIEGLRATLQATIGVVAVYAGKDSNALEGLHTVAHDAIQKADLNAPGCDVGAIRARAETVVDKIIGTLQVTHQ